MMPIRLSRLAALLVVLGLTMAPVSALDWDAVLAEAEGETVYWNAWGGDERTNAFIRWVGERTERRYGVRIRQVKLSDTAEAVTRVLSEQAAGMTSGGSVDLIWINGPNFLAMKERGLLYGPFVEHLPNARYLDLSPDSANSRDFTVPVDGLESPWRLARFVFNHDAARVPEPPRSMPELLDWARANPGAFTHPDPANFMGATFLKQALIELTPDPSALQQPVEEAPVDAITAPFWAWYDALRPHLWRQGRSFPENQFVQQQLLNDGELAIGMSFDPSSAAAAIAEGLLPESVRVFVPEIGTLGNVSFVAIPFNASHRAGALVVANTLLDPEVQAHMQSIDVLGAYSVLAMDRLDAGQLARFAALPGAPALPTLADLGPTLAEPHPSWMTYLADTWAQRYTR